MWANTGISHSKANIENRQIQDVGSVTEYKEGCQEHESCHGHIFRAPGKILLPIQSSDISALVIENNIFRAVSFAFKGNKTSHVANSMSVLDESLKRKTCRMRKSVLDCRMDSSMRMVIKSQKELANNISCVPRNLEDRQTVVNPSGI